MNEDYDGLHPVIMPVRLTKGMERALYIGKLKKTLNINSMKALFIVNFFLLH